MTQTKANLDQVINGRRMPRERAEQAQRRLEWAERQAKATYDKRHKAHLEVGEHNISSRYGIYREDIGVNPHELDRVIDRDACELAQSALERTPYPGIIEFCKGALQSALRDWAIEMGMHPRAASMLQLHLLAIEPMFGDWDLAYSRMLAQRFSMSKRGLPTPRS